MAKNLFEVWLSLQGDMHDSFVVKLDHDDEEQVRKYLRELKNTDKILDYYVKPVEHAALTADELHDELEAMGLV